jgi:hypothetical protein
MSGFAGLMATHHLSTSSLPITTITLQNNGVQSTTVGNPFGTGNAYYFPLCSGTYNATPTGGVYNYGSVANPKTSFGTGDFTLEWFEYQTTTNNWPRRLWMGTGPSWGFDVEGSTAYWWAPTATSFSSSFTSPTGAWKHYAIVRHSAALAFYVSGSQVGSTLSSSSNYTDTTSTLYIGGKPSGYVGEQFVGYMTSIRVCTTAVYTGNFTVPTSSLAATQSANPYGGSNTAAIAAGKCLILIQP